MIAHAHVRIRTNEAVKPDDFEPFIFRIRWERDGSGRPFSDDLDDATLAQTHLIEGLLRNARRAFADIPFVGARNL